MINDRPLYGHQYALTGKPGQNSIMNGNSWAESEVRPVDIAFQTQVRRGAFGLEATSTIGNVVFLTMRRHTGRVVTSTSKSKILSESPNVTVAEPLGYRLPHDGPCPRLTQRTLSEIHIRSVRTLLASVPVPHP